MVAVNLAPDYRVHDLLQLRPALRSDLIFTPCGGRIPYYNVEDPLRGKFYRVGLAEYTLISLLDGRRTLEEVLRDTAAVLRSEAFTEMETAAVVRWLHEAQLLDARGATVDAGRSAESELASRVARHNPLVARIPLVHPQDWFFRLAAICDWLFRPWFVVCWVAIVSAAVISLIAQSERLVAGGREVLYLHRGLWLGACWLALKLIHETAHGLVCTRYGGSVRQAGVVLVLFVPLAYVDVTSSWRFSSPWQRIAVATAGMYAELLVAAVAALIWSVTSAGALNDVCFNVLFMAGVGTLLFNANPLMRFDGYYIVSDLLGLPNLAGLGRTALADLARRWLLGQPARFASGTRRAPVRDRLRSGVLVLEPRGIGGPDRGCRVAVPRRGHRAGGRCRGALVGCAAGPDLCATVAGRQFLRAHGRRTAMRFGVAMVVAAALFAWLPAPWLQRAPAIVEYASLTILRAQAPGLVRQVFVASGEQVASGRALIELENEQLQQELRDLELALEQSELRLCTLRKREQLAALQAELAENKKLADRRQEKQREAAHLTIVAPCMGRSSHPISSNCSARTRRPVRNSWPSATRITRNWCCPSTRKTSRISRTR